MTSLRYVFTSPRATDMAIAHRFVPLSGTRDPKTGIYERCSVNGCDLGAGEHPLTTPRDNQAALAYDDIAEARATLADEFERGHELGRLQGRLEAVVLMALSACAGICVWLVWS